MTDIIGDTAVTVDSSDGIHHQSKKRRTSTDDNLTVAASTNGISKKEDVDDDYFSSYGDIELHRTMIEDQIRTTAYQQAIFKNMEEHMKGKIVADVGCGTGILSMFCAQAGAKKVYAIDASKIAVHAKQLIEANGFKDIITVIQGRAEEVELPEKVDVIVSEWMGYMLFYETMLPSVLHIRNKWLKPGGQMFPDKATLYMALGEAQWITKYEENTYDFWISLNHLYNLDMTLLADNAVNRYKEIVHVHMVSQEDVISFPSKVCELDLLTVTIEQLRSVKHNFKLKSMGSRELNSIIMWFDVGFPNGDVLTTSPDHEDTHWQNTVLPLNLIKVVQDDVVTGDITICQDTKNNRFLNVDLNYSVKNGDVINKKFKMDDNCSE